MQVLSAAAPPRAKRARRGRVGGSVAADLLLQCATRAQARPRRRAHPHPRGHNTVWPDCVRPCSTRACRTGREAGRLPVPAGWRVRLGRKPWGGGHPRLALWRPRTGARGLARGPSDLSLHGGSCARAWWLMASARVHDHVEPTRALRDRRAPARGRLPAPRALPHLKRSACGEPRPGVLRSRGR